jgi:hypothetical protein
MGILGILLCIAGVTKLKLDVVGSEGAVDVEKFGENCGVAQLSRW